ncbi:hypothetical protein SMACR_06895 [Sordaria macrospora]|uniref:Uncharacterized protein n=1 Tax=Sordaria macrospora TaxID=5147 RepID=A0A8S8ZVY1_SORMA|nr:hypothetical protein SMACR_06895 [Sordaria macrospora]WPJ59580.1 hypothetical protein SMAC4_06895 [Sordaria macrospora]
MISGWVTKSLRTSLSFSPTTNQRSNKISNHEVHHLLLPLRHCDTCSSCFCSRSRCRLRPPYHGPQSPSRSQDVRRWHGVLQQWTMLLLQLLRNWILPLDSLREVLVQSSACTLSRSPEIL